MKTLKIAQLSKVWFSIIAVVVVVSLGSLLIQGLNYGIDFIGGTIITIDLHTTFDTNEVKEITDKYDPDATITYSGDNQDTVIISTRQDLSTEQRQEIFNAFKEKYNLENTDLVSVDTVSASVGSEMTRSAIIAVIVAGALMLVYISFRFKFTYGLAAILALLFDILAVIGFYSLFKIQVNTPFIAAILTILGYGINDTIVVFDRIRENRELSPGGNLGHVVDVSAAQTIKRSIYTSVTTLLAIGSIYVFGVPDVKTFALPIIVGVIVSTYASLCVASPLWIVIQERFPDKRRANKSNKNKKTNKQPTV